MSNTLSFAPHLQQISGVNYEWSFGAATFKRRLIILMEEKALSQQVVAEMAGVTQSAVSKWLSGVKPELESVERLARKAGVPAKWLAHGDGHLKIEYRGIDGFIHRTRTRTLPRLDEAIDNLSSVKDARFLSYEEEGALEELEQKLRSRRARLKACVEALEKLPAGEAIAVGEILAKSPPSDDSDTRGYLCWLLGLTMWASDDDVLNACATVLTKIPRPTLAATKNDLKRVPTKVKK